MTDLELLAPAGSPEALHAAVQNGAGAVYLGYGDFNARRNAKNFSQEDFAAAVSYCHLRGVKVYLTLNTLVTDRELPQAAKAAAFAAGQGVDAILVQDLGTLRLLRETVPEVPLHASTQMTVHNLPGALLCQELGIRRVVLSRELSREAIAALCRHAPLELEVFAHGALCMGYSGQCFFSSLVGGRSGNRGLCAQPCRLSYRWQEAEGPGYPLSLKDLSLAGQLEELRDLGVSCLKLEGRMKRPEYVAVVTGIYARALAEGRAPGAQESRQLEQVFSREGFTQGYYLDRKGPAMFGRRRESEQPPQSLLEAARASYTQGEAIRVPLSFSALIQEGAPVRLTVSDHDGNGLTLTGPVPEAARSRALTAQQVQAQLSKTGGTVFSCEEVAVHLTPGLCLPRSALNALRREALEALTAQRCAVSEHMPLPFSPPVKQPTPRAAPGISLSVLRLDQLSPALLSQEPKLVYLPVEEIAQKPDLTADYLSRFPGISFAVTLPRIAWDRELPKLREQLSLCRELGVREALVGNLGLVPLCRELGFRLRGDFGLGVSNSLTMAELSRLGFTSATASFELNFPQIRDLSKCLDTELLAYGRLSMMLTEHCLIRNRDGSCHCDTPQQLIDRKGLAFPMVKAYGCRSELLNAKTLYLADKQEELTSLGLWALRLSFTTEGADACSAILRQYLGQGGDVPEDFTRGLYYRKVE